MILLRYGVMAEEFRCYGKEPLVIALYTPRRQLCKGEVHNMATIVVEAGTQTRTEATFTVKFTNLATGQQQKLADFFQELARDLDDGKLELLEALALGEKLRRALR